MPTKLLDTKQAKPRKVKARPVKAPAKVKPSRGGDSWLRNERQEERVGKNWLPKEKSRDWLKGR